MVRWALELKKYGIKFKPPLAIKAQALADFLAEYSYQETLDDFQQTWEVFADRSSTIGGLGADVVLISPEKKVIEYAVKLYFKASNSEAEYKEKESSYV